ncbi:MAG: serine/threonine-protein kinase [Planctomycetota bacterium]|nr:serine/threonine-protein kinase [Planctomycetota bacterium]
MSNPPDAQHNDRTPELTGREVGEYRLLRRLGRGAMAEVYLADQVSLDRHVAIKVLKPELARDDTYVRRFQMEARAAAALVHGNIVQIYEVGNADGLHFIAQEYVQGQNLSELLKRTGPPPLAVAVDIIRQASAALAKAAEQGIVHRDIKPENLMMATSGELKVADFGLARLTQTPEQLKLTQVGVTMGSPLYMSPEQAEGKQLDPRSDIYSLGVTCYQMLAGHPPFSGDTPLGVAMKHLKTEADSLEDLRPDLPAALCRMVHKMLNKAPADRYANGMEIIRDLRQLNIEGESGDWLADLQRFSLPETIAQDASRATSRPLAAVMQKSTTQKRLTSQRLFWAGLSAAFFFGIIIGWPRTEPSLLENAADSLPPVQAMVSAEQQYNYAMLRDSEAAWKRVIELFPENERYVRLARKQLADHYLVRDRFFEALQIFEEFEHLGESEPEYLAYGLAGQFVILSLDGEKSMAAKKLTQLWPHRNKLQQFDPSLTRQVYQLARKNYQLHDQAKDRELDDWLKSHLNNPLGENSNGA